MTRHIVAWKLKDTYSQEEQIIIKNTMKEKLENLIHLIPELVEIKVTTNLLSSSTADVMLDTVFHSEGDLDIYQNHPDHLAAAGYVRSVVASRSCIDYEY